MSALGGRATAYPEQPEKAGVGDPEADRSSLEEKQSGHRGHSRWMMVACCIPMLVIAALLVAAGAGTGFLIIAIACTVMMTAMMFGMSKGGSR